MIKRNGLILLGIIFLSTLAFNVLAQDSWKELKGDHFIVYYFGEDAFAKNVLDKAEQYYRQIGDDLGYERRSNFWQWDKRVKIHIYKTQKDFLRGTGRQAWSHGYANYTTKDIYTYNWGEGFVESLLPHEITHLIFRDYVGFQGEIPLWLDEGVAQWEEPAKRKVIRDMMRYYLKDGKGYSFRSLSTMDIRNVNNPQAVKIFYVQSASLIDFLVKRYGGSEFVFFCRQLRDGKTLDEALPFAYPTHIRNINELEEQWEQYLTSDV